MAANLEELMKIKCYIMCYYPPYDALILDRIRVEVRKELLKDFLDAKIINKDVYERLIGK